MNLFNTLLLLNRGVSLLMRTEISKYFTWIQLATPSLKMLSPSAMVELKGKMNMVACLRMLMNTIHGGVSAATLKPILRRTILSSHLIGQYRSRDQFQGCTPQDENILRHTLLPLESFLSISSMFCSSGPRDFFLIPASDCQKDWLELYSKAWCS